MGELRTEKWYQGVCTWICSSNQLAQVPNEQSGGGESDGSCISSFCGALTVVVNPYLHSALRVHFESNVHRVRIGCQACAGGRLGARLVPVIVFWLLGEGGKPPRESRFWWDQINACKDLISPFWSHQKRILIYPPLYLSTTFYKRVEEMLSAWFF